ncbi:hypothetical protein F4824DRAFT_403123 [Ustulina deusta]|nr:hypothetical protein F4824DRAFT_403123 [Ustulina deusta]
MQQAFYWGCKKKIKVRVGVETPRVGLIRGRFPFLPFSYFVFPLLLYASFLFSPIVFSLTYLLQILSRLGLFFNGLTSYQLHILQYMSRYQPMSYRETSKTNQIDRQTNRQMAGCYTRPDLTCIHTYHQDGIASPVCLPIVPSGQPAVISAYLVTLPYLASPPTYI